MKVRQLFLRFSAALWLLGLMVAGCQTNGGKFSDVGGDGSVAGVAPQPTESVDLLKVGDVLTVSFTDIPSPPPAYEVRIRDDGKVTLLQNIAFVAAGRTEGVLEAEIRKAYVPDYYVNMTVTVRKANGAYVVEGEVRASGRFAYTGKTTVLGAIAAASGFTDFANKRKVQLIHSNGRKEVENCIKAIDDPTLDLQVFPGDRIHVPRRVF
jgi:protein involved in polysaccharide export with SLBB domain